MIIRFNATAIGILLTILGMLGGSTYYLMEESAKSAVVEYKLHQSEKNQERYDSYIMKSEADKALFKVMLDNGLKNDTIKMESLQHISRELDTIAKAVTYLLDEDQKTKARIKDFYKNNPSLKKANEALTSAILYESK